MVASAHLFGGSKDCQAARWVRCECTERHQPALSFFHPSIPPSALATTVQVHKGFLLAYTVEDMHQRLLQRLWEIITGTGPTPANEESSGKGGAACKLASDGGGGAAAEGGQGGGGGAGRREWRVLCTGHSLGGALATLASYDIAKQAEELSCQGYKVQVRAWCAAALLEFTCCLWQAEGQCQEGVGKSSWLGAIPRLHTSCKLGGLSLSPLRPAGGYTWRWCRCSCTPLAPPGLATTPSAATLCAPCPTPLTPCTPTTRWPRRVRGKSSRTAVGCWALLQLTQSVLCAPMAKEGAWAAVHCCWALLQLT